MQIQEITNDSLTIYTPDMEVMDVIPSVKFVSVVGGGTSFVQTSDFFDVDNCIEINFSKSLPHILTRIESAKPEEIKTLENAPNIKVFIGATCVMLGNISESHTYNQMTVFKTIHNNTHIKTMTISKTVAEKTSIIQMENAPLSKFKDFEN